MLPITNAMRESALDEGMSLFSLQPKQQGIGNREQGAGNLDELKREAEARKPEKRRAMRRELSRIDPDSEMGQPSSAALVAPDGTTVVGDYHHNLRNLLGYGDPKYGTRSWEWEQPFLQDGGVRVRANTGEIGVANSARPASNRSVSPLILLQFL